MKELIRYWASLIMEEQLNEYRNPNNLASKWQVDYANDIMQKVDKQRYLKDPFVFGVSDQDEVGIYIWKNGGEAKYGSKEKHEKVKQEIQKPTQGAVDLANKLLKIKFPEEYEKNPFSVEKSSAKEVGKFISNYKGLLKKH